MSNVNIVALNKRNEPFNLNTINIEQEVFFFYEVDTSISSVDLNGTERWVWNFDSNNTSGLVSDQVIQESIGFNSPLPVVFFREGERSVSLEIYDDSGEIPTLKYSDNVNFPIYKFPDEIIGSDYIKNGSVSSYNIKSVYNTAETYEWFVNGETSGSNSESLSFNYDNIVKAVVQCKVTNGTESVLLEKITLLSIGNSVIGRQYEGNVTPDLKFFNKEGDYLNFQYIQDNGQEYWDGDMIFHENGNDTFKTIGLYILEKVDPIKFKSEDLLLRKLQMFNEYGIDLEPQYEEEILIENIQPVNKQNGFYTKWLIANDIHLKIPLGAELLLSDFNEISIDNSVADNPILTSNRNIDDLDSSMNSTSGGLTTYSVVGNRRDAIMVITNTDNKTFDVNYGYGEFRLQNNSIVNIPQGKVKTLNLIKPIQSQNYNTEWNEPQYKSQIYDRKKLSIVNSQNNDGIYTINFIDDDESNALNSKLLKNNCVLVDDIIPDTKHGFRVQITFKTNKIFLSSSPVDFLPASNNAFLSNKNLLIWESTLGRDFTPPLLKDGNSISFEQLSTPINNLEHIYSVIRTNVASELLKPQTNDMDGWVLSIRNNNLLDNFNLKFIINETTNYSITEGIEWFKGNTVDESVLNLANYMANNINGISVIAVEDELWIWEKSNYTFSLNQEIDNNIIDFREGILTSNNPEYGVVGDQWVLLDNDLYNGYIHHKISQNVYHIVYFEGEYPNQNPIWYPLPLDKKIVWVDPSDSIDYYQNLIADAYLEENTLDFDINGDSDDSVTPEMIASRFVQLYSQTLTTYGLDTYLEKNKLCITRTFTLESIDEKDDYIDVKFLQDSEGVFGTNGTNGIPDYLEINSNIETYNVDLVQVLEPLSLEKNRNFGIYNRPSTLSTQFERKILIKDIDQKFGLVLNINGVNYDVPYDNVGGGTNEREDTILDINETLLDWGNQRFFPSQDITPDDDSDIGRTYNEILERLGILVWLEKSDESYINDIAYFDTIVLQSKYPNVPIQYSINGTLDTHKILNQDINFYEIGSVLTITINRFQYSVRNQGTINSTLLEWKNLYEETLLEQEIIVDHLDGTILGISNISNNIIPSNETLRFSTLEEKTQFDINIWVGKNPLLGKDLYNIIDYKKGNDGMIISGNEALISGVDFQDVGFSTAMITSINNSEFPLNNQEYNLLFVDPNILGLSYQGAFWQNDQGLGHGVVRSNGFDWDTYNEFDNSTSRTSGETILTLSSREFLRYPRERFDGTDPIQFKFSWEEEEDEYKKIFFYDFSGEQLKKSIRDEGVYQYTGIKPLLDEDNTVYLNKIPNRSLNKTNDPSVQQTVFENLTHDLLLVDSENDIDPKPSPLQIFTGFRGDIEGVSSRTMLIHRSENISLNIKTQLKDDNNPLQGYKDILIFDADKSEITLKNSDINFINSGFLIGQRICFTGSDHINTKNQATFKNAGFRGEIIYVTVNVIRFKPLDKKMKSESSLTTTRNELPPFMERDAAFSMKLIVEDSLIGKIKLRGQTEIEDNRFKVMLDNFGKNIKHSDVFIFKEYDIRENGIDWVFLNQKRKEMLSVYPEIYNYVGSYKSVVNAINYFGYNDLEFYEYYLNVDPETDQYQKLHKVEIPDLFNNRIDGFTPNDFILKSLPNRTYEKTKLFNLTYRITDRNGDSVLAYSLEEVITKLLGLKKWLQGELMPVGTRLRDLTGRGETVATTTVWNDMKMSRKFSLNENLTPIDFDIESYIQPVENNSQTHNVNINFFTNNKESVPDFYHVKIMTFKPDTDFKDPNFKLDKIQEINQYKTDLKSINFTTDRTTDPCILIEITCSNGYGANFTRKKSYQI